MGYEVRDPEDDVLLPDARENVYTWYTLEELEGAQWIPSPSEPEEDPNEWFLLKDGRTVCIYSFDLDFPDTGDDLLRAIPPVPASND